MAAKAYRERVKIRYMFKGFIQDIPENMYSILTDKPMQDFLGKCGVKMQWPGSSEGTLNVGGNPLIHGTVSLELEYEDPLPGCLARYAFAEAMKRHVIPRLGERFTVCEIEYDKPDENVLDRPARLDAPAVQATIISHCEVGGVLGYAPIEAVKLLFGDSARPQQQ